MTNYIDKLQQLRFSFRPEEKVDYQLLISLATGVLQDNNSENRQELYHTLQILVLVYGLEEQLKDSGYIFNLNNLKNDIDNINLWISLTLKLYNSLEQSDDFSVTTDVYDLLIKAATYLNEFLDNQSNNTNIETDTFISTPSIETTLESKTLDPVFSPETPSCEYNCSSCNYTSTPSISINQINSKYLKEYIIRKNLLPYKCAKCGLTEWQNQPLGLYLSYKKSNINTVDDVEFLCPNCYSIFGNQ